MDNETFERLTHRAFVARDLIRAGTGLEEACREARLLPQAYQQWLSKAMTLGIDMRIVLRKATTWLVPLQGTRVLGPRGVILRWNL